MICCFIFTRTYEAIFLWRSKRLRSTLRPASRNEGHALNGSTHNALHVSFIYVYFLTYHSWFFFCLCGSCITDFSVVNTEHNVWFHTEKHGTAYHKRFSNSMSTKNYIQVMFAYRCWYSQATVEVIFAFISFVKWSRVWYQQERCIFMFIPMFFLARGMKRSRLPFSLFTGRPAQTTRMRDRFKLFCISVLPSRP